MKKPCPSTAIVFPPYCIVISCANVSAPFASPLTITNFVELMEVKFFQYYF